MTKTSWFNALISSLCLFLVISFASSAVISANTSLRKIDGRLGLLTQPISQNVAWLGDQVKKGIIPFESISVQAQQAVSVVFSVEEVLQQLIASIVQGILNTIVALISQVLNQLGSAIKRIGDVFAKLQSVGAGFSNALQSLSVIKDLLPQISTSAVAIAPNAGKAQNAINTGIINSTACEALIDSQKSLPTAERATDIPTQKNCDDIKQNTADVAVAASCDNSTDNLPLSQLLGAPNACPTATEAATKNKLDNLAQQAKDNSAKKIQDRLAKAPDGCKFAVTQDNQAFQTFSDKLLDRSKTNQTNVFSEGLSTGNTIDFSNANFSPAAGESALNLPDSKIVVPSPKECEFWKSGDLAAITGGLASDKSVPPVKDGGLSAIFTKFLEQVQKLVTDFVNDMVKFVEGLAKQFISAITSIAGGIPVIGNYLKSITGNLTNNSSQLKSFSSTYNFSGCENSFAGCGVTINQDAVAQRQAEINAKLNSSDCQSKQC